jgi:16S rRNA (cytidine1402-2'-O)-methyltransferase
MLLMPAAKLYVVATPIGNLDDISARAVEVLGSVDVIAAEDTRRTLKLLSRYELDRPLSSLHEHNEEQQAPRLVGKLLKGVSIALVSDAGTPLISDPGFRLVKLALESGIEVVPIPGPSAITAALSVSGLPTDRFTFEGFLPARTAARIKRLEQLKNEPGTMIFFESGHRIRNCLEDMMKVFGPDRPVALCRELTKRFETVLRGDLERIGQKLEEDPDQSKGEFVLVVAGSTGQSADQMPEAEKLARELRDHLGTSQAARVAARIHGVSRRELYRRLEIESG